MLDGEGAASMRPGRTVSVAPSFAVTEANAASSPMLAPAVTSAPCGPVLSLFVRSALAP